MPPVVFPPAQPYSPFPLFGLHSHLLKRNPVPTKVVLGEDFRRFVVSESGSESPEVIDERRDSPCSMLPFPAPARPIRDFGSGSSSGKLPQAMAHQLNNVLTVILGHTEFLLKRPESAENFHLRVAEIRQAAERGLLLTEQLLASMNPRRPSR
jgi:signal transduction histidine kinase